MKMSEPIPGRDSALTQEQGDTNLTREHALAALFLSYEFKSPTTKLFLEVMLENARLFDKKQLDYGPKNVSGFGDFGVLVRMNDKFERLKNIYNTRRRRPQNESINDSLRDICNYAVIAMMLRTERWPS